MSKLLILSQIVDHLLMLEGLKKLLRKTSWQNVLISRLKLSVGFKESMLRINTHQLISGTSKVDILRGGYGRFKKCSRLTDVSMQFDTN